jgi:hypothetical protein
VVREILWGLGVVLYFNWMHWRNLHGWDDSSENSEK